MNCVRSNYLVCGILLVLAWTGAVTAAEDDGLETITNRVHRLRVTAPARQLPALARLSRRCAKEFQRHVQPREDTLPLPWIVIRMGPEDSRGEAASTPYRVALAGDESLTVAVDAMMRGLVARYCRQPLDGSGQERGEAYAWLAAGLGYRIRYAADGLAPAGGARYDCIEGRIRSGNLPSPASLIEGAVPAREELMYRLYALHCRLLLDVLETGTEEEEGSGVARLLRLIAGGRPAADSFRYVAAARMDQTETLSEWVQRQAVEVVRSGLDPVSPTWLAQRLAQAEIVTLVLPDPDGGARRKEVPIDELGSLLETKASRRSLAGQLENDFNHLIRVAPPLLRPALVEYAKTFDLLRHGRRRRYRRAVHQAEEAAWAALRRYQDLVRFLHRFEQENADFEEIYPFHRYVVQEWMRMRRSLLPEFYELLDQAKKR